MEVLNTFVTFCFFIFNGFNADDITEDQLIMDLLKDYNKMAIPTTIDRQAVEVVHSVTPMELVSLDNNIITIHAYQTISWNDSRLVWDPSKYHNLTGVNIPSRELWKPDIKLLNSTGSDKCFDFPAMVDCFGRVYIVPICRLASYCNNHGNPDSDGVYTCALTFTSMTYEIERLNLANHLKYIEMYEFQPNREWSVTNTTVTEHDRLHEGLSELPKRELDYTLKLKRKYSCY